MNQIKSWEQTLFISKHSESLIQLLTITKIHPSGWKCFKCDLTSNLWLNLTDGSILCGRRHYDGTGGNDHALEHYKLTKYFSLNFFDSVFTIKYLSSSHGLECNIVFFNHKAVFMYRVD